MSEARHTWHGVGTTEIVGVLVLGGATALLVFGGIQPALRSRAESAARQQTLSIVAANREQLDRTDAELQQRLASVTEQISALPEMGSPRDTNARLARLNEIATSYGVVVDELSPQKATREGPLQRLPIHLAGSAEFGVFASFLERVHQQMPDLVVASFAISQGTPRGSSSEKFSVDFSLYAVSEDAPATR